MTVFLTGGTGFVGGALLQALLNQGHQVTALARRLPDNGFEDRPGLRWVRGDITQDGPWPAAITGHDTVVHAAGRLGVFGVSEAAYNLLHVEGTRRVLYGAEAAGVKKILYVSSPGVLGSTDGPPQRETAPYQPTNPYERSKAQAEKLVRQRAATGVPVVIVRPEFMYGPGDLHVLGLFQAVHSGRFFLINGGRSTCHPTYIDDGVNGMLLALERGRPGEIYHIAGEAPVPFQDFIAEMARALKCRPPRLSLPRPLTLAAATVLEQLGRWTGITPPLTRSAVDFFSTSYRFSWEKARQELGYEPQVPLAIGLEKTVAWYRQNGYL